jgi:eukaryotic-like serine/threonine-protein kinase
VTRRLGTLEIIGELGPGGMGAVLLARKSGAHGFEKLIAVKTIRRDLLRSEQARLMFLDEARLMARLDHPSIAQVHDFGEEDGVLYLAMEYVAGVTLQKLLAAGKAPFPPAVAARLVAEVCRGLHAAHELTDHGGRKLGVVHRDISPNNLMLSFDGHIKILDFGIALFRDREAPVTQVGLLRGKPAYMSPEQLLGRPIDRKSDIYATGIVLWELLTGQKLFTADLMRRISEASEPPAIAPPSSLGGPMPPTLDAAALKALAIRPEDRFPDARAMAIALEPAAMSSDPGEVDTFLERVLSGAREDHRAHLSALLEPFSGGRAPRTPPPPPQGPVTVAERDVVPPSAEVVLTGDMSVGGVSTKGRARRARRAIGSIVVLFALIAMGVAAGVAAKSSLRMQEGRADAPPRILPPARGLAATSTADPSATPAASRDAIEHDLEDRSAPPVATSQKGAAASPQTSDAPRHGRRREVRLRRSLVPVPAVAEQAETPEKPVVSVKPGFLTVGADPYGIVVLDGRDVDMTPLVDFGVHAGKHTLKVLDPLTRAVRIEREIAIEEGRHLRLKF